MRTIIVLAIAVAVILIDLFWWCQCRIKHKQDTYKMILDKYFPSSIPPLSNANPPYPPLAKGGGGDSDSENITLAEFKKRQGIAKLTDLIGKKI